LSVMPVYGIKLIALSPEDFRKILREELTSGDPNVSTPIMLGAKPSIAHAKATVAGDVLSIVPPSGQYVYLMILVGNVGTDGDTISLQALDADGVTWREFLTLKLLGNTSTVLGFPNLKLDKVTIVGTEYTIFVGDGVTATFKVVGSGTGPWEVTVLYFCAP